MVGGRKLADVFDDRLAAHVGEPRRRRLEIGAELAVERVGLLQEKAEGQRRRVDAHASFEQRRAVKADRLGGAEHPFGGRLAHAMAPVEDAIDGGDADAGGAREIGECRTLAHVSPSVCKSCRTERASRDGK